MVWIMSKLINLVLISYVVESRICGISEDHALSGSFKHVQHKDAVKEACWYQIKTKENQKVKFEFAKYVVCDQAQIKIVDKNGEHGPYCEPINRAHGLETYGLETFNNMKQFREEEFEGPDVQVIFEPGANDKTMRMRVNFQWEIGRVFYQI